LKENYADIRASAGRLTGVAEQKFWNSERECEKAERREAEKKAEAEKA